MYHIMTGIIFIVGLDDGKEPKVFKSPAVVLSKRENALATPTVRRAMSD